MSTSIETPDPDPAKPPNSKSSFIHLNGSTAAAASQSAHLTHTVTITPPTPKAATVTPSPAARGPRAEILGDRLKSVILDPSHPQYGKLQRICILDVDRNFTIEAVHGHALKPKVGTSGEAPLHVEGSASTTSLASSQSTHSLIDNEEVDTTGLVIYPHDADVVLKSLDPSIHVETLYLRPDVRQSIAAIRRRKHTVDVFINLYDRADETGQKIVDYMQNQGLAFTGAGSRFYDPTRMELKRLCRYSKIPTPAFAIVVDTLNVPELADELGLSPTTPLFVKPEHGYDSVGIDEKSLIYNIDDLSARVAKIIDEFGSALVERYVDGREFSVLVAGTKGKMEVFPPVEYRFPKDRLPGNAANQGAAGVVAGLLNTMNGSVMNSLALGNESPLSDTSSSDITPSLSPTPTLSSSTSSSASSTQQAPPQQQQQQQQGPAFITFEDKWGANFENRWFLLDPLESELIEQLKATATKLYEAFEGEGLCRFDIRYDQTTKQLMVLDANPNCSLFYKDECTADTILRMTNYTKERFMMFLIQHALDRQRKFHQKNSFLVKYSEEHGFSLHASRDLKAGDLVYSDEESPLRLITRQYAQRTWSDKEMLSFDAYAWPVGENVYAIWDQESSKWKPINHSCDPNTWMDGLQVIARRPIASGDELTLDYATFEPSHPSFECWCGATNCRRMIHPNEYKEEWFQARYGEHVSPHILMLIGRELMEKQRRIKNGGEVGTPATAVKI